MSSFIFRPLSLESLKDEAVQFSRLPIPYSGSGPQIGDVIEARFRDWLLDLDYDIPEKSKSGADFAQLNVDVKALNTRGKRGGAAKIHGYSKSGPPNYDLLVFLYWVRTEHIHFESVAFVPRDSIDWVRANHYLWSVPDRAFVNFELR